ncbi:uncharacterized protein LOC122077462 [Macadamia integrifolia]|uniref:uncharacterized protein LOC122077462 n=1 Tax=Macadamia integrifolia TaxID=60698 RepID=UPI001C4FB3B0|nr:uncharacterized protein LOC122077462 [Macadamia integrifolia]
MVEEENMVEKAKKWIEGLGKEGSISNDIEYLSLCDIQVLKAQKGYFFCNLKLHHKLADQSGNCHVGAIATIIDVVGCAVIATYEGDIKVSLNFSISYFDTVKIQEEVEIEGKMVAERERFSLTIVELRRKKDGVLVALGKQWMSQVNYGQSLRSKL